MKEMLGVAEAKNRKKKKGYRTRRFWFKKLSQASFIILIFCLHYKEKGGLYIRASGLMSQRVLCKGDDSHPSCMTCWKPRRKGKREEKKDRRA
jgi:hypothetical protein